MNEVAINTPNKNILDLFLNTNVFNFSRKNKSCFVDSFSLIQTNNTILINNYEALTERNFASRFLVLEVDN